jgi:NhaP-type Na+/H+ or K+/H+ antiporter
VSWALVWVALAVLAVAGGSRLLTGTAVTPAIVFVLVGMLVGPEGVDGVSVSPTSGTVRTLAEATLAIVLFSDASRIKLGALRREFAVPLRLLGIGLPLTIALGAALAAALFGEFTVAEALVLAVVLAPTDAALGQAVVTEPRLPSRIRQGLNVESGLNDGICVPLLFIVLAYAEADSKTESGHHALSIVAEEIGYGIVGGIAAGLLASAVVTIAGRRGLITALWLQVIPIAGAALAYGLAAALGGSGFIAAFLAGGIFGGMVPRESEEAAGFSEDVGNLLDGVTFVVFGAVLLGPTLSHLNWQIAAYAVLSLTVVRMLPVAVSMLGAGARVPTIAFLGWFGPRGLASIVFAVIVVQESHLPQTSTILLVTYTTVGLSVLVHGLTAAPLANRYAKWYESHARARRPPMEAVPAAPHRARGTEQSGALID